MDKRLLITVFLFFLFELNYLRSTEKPKKDIDKMTHHGSVLSITNYQSAEPNSASDIPAPLRPFFFEKIPVNTASPDLLQTVKGVGPSLSKKIISYRELHGSIDGVNKLLRIQGIGKKRSKYLANHLSFE